MANYFYISKTLMTGKDKRLSRVPLEEGNLKMKKLQFIFREIDYSVKITKYPVANFVEDGEDETNDIYYKAEAYAPGKYYWDACVEYIPESKIGDAEYIINECKQFIIDVEEAEECAKRYGLI
jgi:hypothetical protein